MSICLKACLCIVCLQCPMGPEAGIGSPDTVISDCWGAGIEPSFSGRAASALTDLSIIAGPLLHFYLSKVLILSMIRYC